MRILDTKTSSSLMNVSIYLELREIDYLIGALEDLKEKPEETHRHVSDDAYQHEITVAVYTDKNLNQFDERSRKLIAEDK